MFSFFVQRKNHKYPFSNIDGKMSSFLWWPRAAIGILLYFQLFPFKMNGFSYLILLILFYFHVHFQNNLKSWKNERKSKPSVLDEINLKVIKSKKKVSEIKTN